MAENKNILDRDTRLIDLTGLTTFWDQAKIYIGNQNTAAVNEAKEYTNTKFNEVNTVLNGDGTDNNKGLVDAVATLRTDVDALGGTEGGIQGMIDATINGLDLPNTYDAKGAAATAEKNAKDHADGLNSAMNTRMQAVEAGVDGVDGKITAAFNDFATKVSNDKTVNTYKELIDYAADHSSEFTELVGVVGNKADKTYVDGLDSAMGNRVKALEDHKDDYIAADEAVLASANTYAKTYANVLVYKIENTNDPTIEATWTPRFDAAGSAATAKSEAIAHANGVATTAENNAKTYTDGQLASIVIADDDDIKAIFTPKQA